MTDEKFYLRNASINQVNGMIVMAFSCDGAQYIDHKTFFEMLDSFATLSADNRRVPACQQSLAASCPI